MATPRLPIRRAPATAAALRRARLRQDLFPDVTEEMVWSRTRFVGFTTVPRTLPLILTIIDALDRRNAGRVYFDLWCRAFEEAFVEVKDEYESALSCGYSGQRAIRSWRERVSVLEQFGFVRAHMASYGGYRYVLVLEPHSAVSHAYDNDLVSEEHMRTLQNQLISIGAIRES